MIIQPEADLGSVKRCRDQHLEEAFQLLTGVSKGLWELDRDTMLPLVRCVLIIAKLAEGNEALVSKEVEEFMDGLAKDNEVGDLVVFSFENKFFGKTEESTLGRCYWKSNLMLLLRCIAATFEFILEDLRARKEEWYYLTVKICLQLFKWMPKDILPLAWDGMDHAGILQRILGSLMQTMMGKVEGVSDFIRSSFQFLLEIYSRDCDHFEALERPLYEELLRRIVLNLYADLPRHLLRCLSTNHLCPVASDVYKTFLQLQRKAWTEGQGLVPEDKLAQMWAHHWLPTLSDALTSPDTFLQCNASNYLLVWTLRLFPASSALLAKSFSGTHTPQLRAWVTLLNVHKTLAGALPEDPETLERLVSCLFSEEENIRLAALGLLCSSPRTNQALSEIEVHLLKEFLPLNLNCDSSSFRQLLQASVKKALVRMRDSSLVVLRQKASNKKPQSPQQASNLIGKNREISLVQAVDFIEWLLQLCMSSLTSGPNYQRKKTSLLLLAAIMETCTDTWNPERKKGQPPRNMVALLNWARSKGCWDFFSRSNTLTLLSCLQDGTNEIRELASELLVRYFPSHFPESIVASLFERAQEAMSSPRVQEVEAAAVLMKTILQKLDGCTLKQLLPAAVEEPTEQCQCLCFLEHLLGMLRDHFAVACQSMLQAARTKPIHGVISALRRCLLEVPEVLASMQRAQQAPQWQMFLHCLVNTTKDISSFLLGVLQGKQASNIEQPAAAPSFADMGNAIGSLIQLEKDLASQEEEEDSVLLSEEHSLILTCCWVSVKEIGLLLGGLAEKVLPLAPLGGCGSLLTLQVVTLEAEVFQDILLKCRHWCKKRREGYQTMQNSALTVRLLGQKRTRDEGPSQEGLSSEALFSSYPQLRSILLGELGSAAEASVSRGTQRGKLRFDSICFLEPLIQLSGNPIYAVRVMAARALVPLVPLTEYGKVLLQLASSLPQPEDALSHNVMHGCLLQIQALLTRAQHVSCLSPDALLPIASRMEDCIWLLTGVQQCPLVRTAYLQAISLLIGNCSQSFAQQVWKIVSRDLDDCKLTKMQSISPVQVGLATFYQHAVRFLCHEATRLACPERVGQLHWFLRRGNVDVQGAILTWVIEEQERLSLNLRKDLHLTLLENLEVVLKEKTDYVLLKLYLEAFVHLCGDPSFQNGPFPQKPLGAGCREILLSMVERGQLSPEIQGLVLCVVAFLLTLNSEDYSLWDQWVALVERCSKACSSEVLRRSAAKSLKIAGRDLIQRAQDSSSSALRGVALRLIDAGIGLLQDEDHEVRHEAAIFASLVVVPPQNDCIWLQTNKALLGLLHLLLEKFGSFPETFATLVHHLPTINLSSALTKLEAKGAVSLYKEDEANVYAEPGIFSQMLLPFLLHLHNRASNSPELWEVIQSWLKATGPEVFSSLKHCKQWWSQGSNTSLHLNALVCPKVHIAVATLVVKAILVLHILESMEERKVPSVEGILFTCQELRCEVRAMQKLLKEHGMTSPVATEMEQVPTGGNKNQPECVCSMRTSSHKEEEERERGL
ncbi:hypothetical protein JD844_015164 [Phrynosoma platyrhinos]|uniref:Thyroid adenoma-associated protein homolog n=1 Tax=Phrynosoma platyrhinos TaxID=52577 RepID=A0ABQ7T773_PHRPL|nr:hypothetical protein JD844_015164 [Phrynosoma platyrhinos]